MLLEASIIYCHGVSGEKEQLMLFTVLGEHVDFRQGWVGFACVLGTKLTHIPAASQMQKKHPIPLIVFLLPVTPPGMCP